MPRRCVILTLLLPAAAAAATPLPRVGRWLDAAAFERGAPSRAPWPGRIPAADDRGFDVLHYDLDLNLDVAHSSLAGDAGITLRLLAAPTGGLRLDLVDAMPASAVVWDGAPAPWVQRGDSLLVTAPATAAAGDTATITVTYAGRPPRHGPLYSGLMFRAHGAGTPDDPTDDGPSVANVSEPYSAHSWFPCKDHPADKATLRLAAETADSLVAVSNGVRVSDTPTTPGRHRVVWRTDHAIATYLVGLAVSDYATADTLCPCTAGDLPLATYAFPADRALADTVFAPTCEMLQWLEGLAGPYAFADEKYAQAEMIWGGAMENQTATVVGQTALFQGESAHLVVVHELSHQWFGDAVTPARWRDIWLNEGFARYSEALWLEHTEGQAAMLAYMHLLGPGHDPDLFQNAGLLGDPDPLITLLVYNKGAWLLHMLRFHVGDAAFFAGLRAWATDSRWHYGDATTADFVAVMSAAADEDLTSFVAPWLETQAVPEIAVQVQPRQPGDPKLTHLLVTQTQTPFFPLTVPVRLYFGGETIDVRVRCNTPRQVASVPQVGAVDSLVVDPDGWLLWRAVTTPAPTMQILAPRPNPARNAVTLAFTLRETAATTVRVFDARGRRLGVWSLGTLAAGGDIPHTWTWDGHDDAGRRVAAGVYWFVITAGRGRAVGKATLLR